ncbi:nitrogen regulation protein NR(II) [Nitrosomonas sp.]|uniref:two-component system sensor histidine kinase NtrB n=1 Tax=Nitrosomonas sp. TaxID=42353 RepID=UPI0025FAF524|nr:ATP-binding protein [Nitrosomonas sp.]
MGDTSLNTDHTEQFWRSLFYFSIYRLTIAGGVFVASSIFQFSSLGAHNTNLFVSSALGYVLFCCISIALAKIRLPNFDWQLIFQIGCDVLFICIMIYASGGIKSGLGVLLMVSLAGAGLISRGRLALFFASIASIGMLLQETYAVVNLANYQAQYMHVGFLSMGYFAIAWLAHRLATHAIASEQLAIQRGTDLEKMLQVNQLVIHDMQDGVLVVDSNGEIRQRNYFAETLIGLKSASTTTEFPKLADYVPTLASRLATWHDDKNTEFELLRLPANNILIRTRFVPIKGNNRAGVVIFLEDMSRIQAQVQQLKLAALGRLTANIAHEIRNPLSAISHAAELLAEEQSNANTTRPRLIHIIRNNTQRLNKIVQDVLQLNRRDIAEPENIDIEVFLRTFINDFCLTEKIDSEKFTLEITEKYFIVFDQGHLNQILWNLCRNAWRYCRRKKGSIRLRLANGPNENNIMLDIIDDGTGVSPAQLKQLFEPFFTTASGGTGLGLYIARELCEANQASLGCIENPDGGHFRIICKQSLTHD